VKEKLEGRQEAIIPQDISWKVRENFRIEASISYLIIMITDKDLAEYQALREKNGFPEISNKDALVEASALVNLMILVVKEERRKELASLKTPIWKDI
jgi:hypothetical protein